MNIIIISTRSSSILTDLCDHYFRYVEKIFVLFYVFAENAPMNGFSPDLAHGIIHFTDVTGCAKLPFFVDGEGSRSRMCDCDGSVILPFSIDLGCWHYVYLVRYWFATAVDDLLLNSVSVSDSTCLSVCSSAIVCFSCEPCYLPACLLLCFFSESTSSADR